MSRIFTKSTSVLSRSGIPLPFLLKCNSQLEARGRKKEERRRQKRRQKYAENGTLRAILFIKPCWDARVVCLETILGINPIGIDLVIGSLPLYACSSELFPTHGCATTATSLSITDHERERCVCGRRSYLTRVAFLIGQKGQRANRVFNSISSVALSYPLSSDHSWIVNVLIFSCARVWLSLNLREFQRFAMLKRDIRTNFDCEKIISLHFFISHGNAR